MNKILQYKNATQHPEASGDAVKYNSPVPKKYLQSHQTIFKKEKPYHTMKSAIIFFALVIAACSKSSGVDGGTVSNHAPLASLAASITNINPFTVDFTVT
ncbi:MAG TPA: hypothetical protein PL045_08055, partial [Chitinophagaceae bacterium]|nr:hypothetical protein [Chitinophagaceae bacterium]